MFNAFIPLLTGYVRKILRQEPEAARNVATIIRNMSAALLDGDERTYVYYLDNLKLPDDLDDILWEVFSTLNGIENNGD